MILADQPTASLDTDRALSVMRLLRKLSTEQGTAVLVVTHDERMIGGVDRVLQLVDGRVVSDEPQSKAQSPVPRDALKTVTDNRQKSAESTVQVASRLGVLGVGSQNAVGR